MKLLTPASVRIPARKRRAWLLGLALLAIPVTVATASEPPSRIVLQVPEAALHAGQPATLAVELTGENGKPAVALEDIHIELQGLGGLSRTASLTIPAGSSRAELPIQAPKPGLWQIEARSRGLVSGNGVVACVAEKAKVLKSARENPSAMVLPPGRVLTSRDRNLSRVRRRPCPLSRWAVQAGPARIPQCLSPPLRIRGSTAELPGLASAGTELWVRLLDDDGEPVSRKYRST